MSDCFVCGCIAWNKSGKSFTVRFYPGYHSGVVSLKEVNQLQERKITRAEILNFRPYLLRQASRQQTLGMRPADPVKIILTMETET